MQPGTPLWQVVPTHDENGGPIVDFMMVLPGLKHRSQSDIDFKVATVYRTLSRFTEVVFANVNVSINVLWVSLKPRHGATLEIAAAIKQRVPEALLVAQKIPQ